MQPVKPAASSPKDLSYYAAAGLSLGLLGWSAALVLFFLFAIFVAPLLH